MTLHLRDWLDRVPPWLIAMLGVCGLLVAAVGDRVVPALVLLGLSAGLAIYRYRATLHGSDFWAIEEWIKTRRAAFGICEWRSPYQAAALYGTPAMVRTRDEAAREMNAMMMEIVRGEHASMETMTGVSAESLRTSQQSRYEAAQFRHDRSNAALGRELAALLASGELMAKGLLLGQGSAKAERIIPVSRWRLLELNIAKAEASGPAGDYAGILIGKPPVKPAPKPPQPAAKREPSPPAAAPRPPTAGEGSAPRG